MSKGASPTAAPSVAPSSMLPMLAVRRLGVLTLAAKHPEKTVVAPRYEPLQFKSMEFATTPCPLWGAAALSVQR